MPIARCCTATRRNCARCARLTGSKRCISRGILGQRLRNARPSPSSSSKMLRSTLSLSLTSSPAAPISSSAAPHPNGWSRRRSRATLSGRCFRPTYPNIPPPTPFHSSASLSLALSLASPTTGSPHSAASLRPPPAHGCTRSAAPSASLSFFLSFFLSPSPSERWYSLPAIFPYSIGPYSPLHFLKG